MPNNQSASIHWHPPSDEGIAANRTSFIILGIIMMLAGTAAMVFPFASSWTVDIIVGTTFAIAGLIYVVHAFGCGGGGGMLWEIVVGLVYLAAGLFLMVKPVEGTAILTFVVALSLVADGIVRTAVAVIMRRGPWGWMLFSGIVSIILGGALIAMFPIAALWLLGVLAGVNLLITGMVFLMLALTASEGTEVDVQSTSTNAEPA